MTDHQTDRELLERAAKAAGIAVEWCSEGKAWIKWPYVVWNPLTDGGDALRLAVKLRIFIEFSDGLRMVNAGTRLEPYEADPCAATRRAIVRAAAAMAGEG